MHIGLLKHCAVSAARQLREPMPHSLTHTLYDPQTLMVLYGLIRHNPEYWYHTITTHSISPFLIHSRTWFI